jgi:hypothetical protein
MVQGSNTSGVEIFRIHPYQPQGLPSLLFSGYWMFPRGEAAGAVVFTTHPNLVPRLKEE